MTEISIDRAVVREMVEDFWRSYVLFMRDLQHSNPSGQPEDLREQCLQFSRRAWDRFEATAALMPAAQGEAFMKMIDEEDTILSQEHHFHPESFYRRVGLSSPARISVSLKERNEFYRRHELDPAAVDSFIRSGDKATSDCIGPSPLHSRHQRQTIGDMAVRTAIRASIWQIIRAVFRW